MPNHASKCLVDVFSIRSHLIGVIRYLDFCDCCVFVVCVVCVLSMLSKHVFLMFCRCFAHILQSMNRCLADKQNTENQQHTFFYSFLAISVCVCEISFFGTDSNQKAIKFPSGNRSNINQRSMFLEDSDLRCSLSASG